MTIENALYPDLKTVQELMYDECGFTLTNLKMNSEGKEYAACSFNLNGYAVVHRSSKITPTKTGQFVTLWKRNQKGITESFDTSDNIDFIVITARSGDNLGQFIFPASVLVDKGVMSTNGKGGKRGIRVYPSWDVVTNKQAEKTQGWQVKYFVVMKSKSLAAFELTRKLFGKTS